MIDHTNEQALLVIIKSYNLYLSVFKHNLKLPKNARYSLGVRNENLLLDLMHQLSLSARLPKVSKEPQLLKAGAIADTLKLSIRLIHELDMIELRHYLKLQEKIDEINRMIGGWIKFVRNNS